MDAMIEEESWLNLVVAFLLQDFSFWRKLFIFLHRELLRTSTEAREIHVMELMVFWIGLEKQRGLFEGQSGK